MFLSTPSRVRKDTYRSLQFELDTRSQQASQLVAWWPGAMPGALPELDLTPWQNNGTRDGVITDFVLHPKFGSIRVNSFDGTNDFVSIPDTPQTRPSEFSLTAWIYPRAYGTDGWGRAIYHRFGPGSNTGPTLALSDNVGQEKKGWFAVGDGSTFNSAFTTDDIPLNEWSHLVGSVDSAGNMRIFLNGEEQGLTTGVTPDHGTNDPNIGRNTDGTTARHWDGYIQDFRIYSRALLEDEVRWHYQSPESLVKPRNSRVYFINDFNKSASNTIVFSQSASHTATLNLSASDTVVFAQSAQRPRVLLLTGSGSLSLAQSGKHNMFELSGSNNLAFGQQSSTGVPINLSASQNVVFSQNNALSGNLNLTASNTLSLSASNLRSHILDSGTELSASDTLVPAQSNNRVKVESTVINLTASDTLTLSQRPAIPINLDGSNTLTLSLSGVSQKIHSAIANLTLGQQATLIVIRNMTASNVFDVSHAFTVLSSSQSVKEYSPRIGSGSVNFDATLRPITRQTSVKLAWPATGPITKSVTLKTPEFGNRHTIQFNRVNRESRGGSLTIFRDPNWPEQATLGLDFVGLKESEAQDLLTFISDTLGDEVSFRDWENRLWKGIITSSEDPIIRSRRNSIDASLEIDAEEVIPANTGATQTLVLSASNSTEVV